MPSQWANGLRGSPSRVVLPLLLSALLWQSAASSRARAQDIPPHPQVPIPRSVTLAPGGVIEFAGPWDPPGRLVTASGLQGPRASYLGPPSVLIESESDQAATVAYDGKTLTIAAPDGWHVLVAGSPFSCSSGEGQPNVAVCPRAFSPPPILATFITVPVNVQPALSGQADDEPGWNLVAGPSGSVIEHAVGPLYTLAPGGDGYQTVPAGTPLQAGMAYWADFDMQMPEALLGDSPSPFTATLPAGQWTLIGNPFPERAAISGADIVERYLDGVGYRQTDTLAPGEGAWAYSAVGATVALTALVQNHTGCSG